MSTSKKLNLTETPKIVNWPETHYVFVEKAGFSSFQETAPGAWQEVLPVAAALSENAKITGTMSLYKTEPKRIYRAGFILDSKPGKLPTGVQYEKFKGGKYSCFVLTGPYSNLPEACGRVFDIVESTKIKVRDDFCIEHYANDPRSTPEDKLITEILIPTV